MRKIVAVNGSDELEKRIIELKAEIEDLQRVRSEIIDSGVSNQGNSNIVVGAGSIVSIENNIYKGPKPKDDEQALHIYCQVLMNSTGSLPLRGVDVSAADLDAQRPSMGLVNVYVDLDTKTLSTKKERGSRSAENLLTLESEPRAQLSALDALIANRRLVLLGEPGSGKSTFISYIAHCFAGNLIEPTQGWLKHLRGWPKEETCIVPLIIVFRDFAQYLSKRPSHSVSPSFLLDFVKKTLKEQNLAFVERPMEKYLEEGKALVLLDGLDEVPAKNRSFVRDLAQSFSDRYRKCRYLVTCRVLSYQSPRQPDEVDIRLINFPVQELAPFTERKIDRFIETWYDELLRLGIVKKENSGEMANELHEAIRHPDIFQLASNPLLLTVIAILHTHKGRLPDARAKLFEDAIDILLWRLELTKGGDQPLLELLNIAGRSEMDLKRLFWDLAFNVHAQVKDGDRGDGLADISELNLLRTLATLKRQDNKPDFNWAQKVLEVIRLRSGMLVERMPDVFTFPHRTFQEYLAGAHLAVQTNFPLLAKDLIEKDVLWRDVIILAVGRLVHVIGDTTKPLALVGEMCPAEILNDDLSWNKLLLAGDVLSEMGPDRATDMALGQELLKRVRSRLILFLNKSHMDSKRHCQAGNMLSFLGDARFNSESWYLPQEPLLGFVKIPSCVFKIGTDEIDIDSLQRKYGGEAKWYERQTPRINVSLPDYYVARYPVTVAQFNAFLESEKRSHHKLPYILNHPIVNVSWYQAVRYCCWLDEKLKATSIQKVNSNIKSSEREFWEGIANGHWRIMLLSEPEWEHAARGDQNNDFPWGNEFNRDLANADQTGIGNTSSVGCFVAGASPFGLLDMSGNVWEWTRSLYCSYQYLPVDINEVSSDRPVKEIFRILRGGSFGYGAGDARCANRLKYPPNKGGRDLGFRVGLVPLADTVFDDFCRQAHEIEYVSKTQHG